MNVINISMTVLLYWAIVSVSVVLVDQLSAKDLAKIRFHLAKLLAHVGIREFAVRAL